MLFNFVPYPIYRCSCTTCNKASGVNYKLFKASRTSKAKKIVKSTLKLEAYKSTEVRDSSTYLTKRHRAIYAPPANIHAYANSATKSKIRSPWSPCAVVYTKSADKLMTCDRCETWGCMRSLEMTAIMQNVLRNLAEKPCWQLLVLSRLYK